MDQPIPSSRAVSRPVARGWFHLTIWAVVLLMVPFYLFPSGRPQVADFILALLALLVLLDARFRLAAEFRGVVRILGAFAGYILLVNLSWYGLIGGRKFLFSATYYVFNLAVFVTVLQLYGRYGARFLRVTLWVSVGSIVLQASLGIVSGGGARSTLYFNNPNQLGYYVVTVSSLILVLAQKVELSRLILAGVLIASALLTYMSHSRAAALSIAALIVTLVVRRPAVIIVGLVVLGAGITLFEFQATQTSTQQRLWQRRITKSQKMSTEEHMQERGWNRIVEHPQHLALGAGEGGNQRFSIHNLELHSSLGTIVFCYGFVGAMLFSIFALQVYKRAGFGLFVFTIPVLMFGMAHQGLRFRIFWCFLASVVAVGHEMHSSARRS